MKLKMYNVRGEEALLAQAWSDRTTIEISIVKVL